MMKIKKRFSKLYLQLFLSLAIAATIKVISCKRSFVEQYYSTSTYKYIAIFLRSLTRWLPFSAGDILYSATAIYLFIQVILFVKTLFQKNITKESLVIGLLKNIRFCLWLYIMFNFLWGLNYNRLGIAYQLQIEPKDYTTIDLENLTSDLVKSVNAARNAPGMFTYQFEDDKTLFFEAANAYRNVQRRFPFLTYSQPCLKTALFSQVDNYFGVVGYYNPFTAEAQINSSVPRFLLPYIITHEIAHQIGYANEDEANFTAYLASVAADDNVFRYSVYFNLFNYANRQLIYKDSSAALRNYSALDSLVKVDECIYQHFLGKKPNSESHFATALYSDYLKANDQHLGMETYDRVIMWLIVYQKKYGEL